MNKGPTSQRQGGGRLKITRYYERKNVGSLCWIVAYRAWGYAGLRICRVALCG